MDETITVKFHKADSPETMKGISGMQDLDEAHLWAERAIAQGDAFGVVIIDIWSYGPSKA